MLAKSCPRPIEHSTWKKEQNKICFAIFGAYYREIWIHYIGKLNRRPGDMRQSGCHQSGKMRRTRITEERN
jgi:hypothetical protein